VTAIRLRVSWLTFAGLFVEAVALPHNAPLARYSGRAAFMSRQIPDRDSAALILRVSDFTLCCAIVRCCNMKRAMTLLR
jgi:hypothetical protein